MFDVRKEKNSFPYHLRISFCAKEGFLGASSSQHVAVECSSSVTFLSLFSLLEHIFHRYQTVGPNVLELMAVQNIWEIHPLTCCLIVYFVKALHLMLFIVRRVLKQLKHLHSLAHVKIR